MSLNAYKISTHEMCLNRNWDKTPIHTVWLLLTEEIGELAAAIRQQSKGLRKPSRHRRQDGVEMEMGDVFSYLFQLAHMLNVDLDEMWRLHQAKLTKRNYINIKHK